MDRWNGKIAVVTGASSGIGAAICKDLVKCGVVVIGLARRVERVEAFQAELNGFKSKLYAHFCDVSAEDSIRSAFDWIEQEFGVVNILINNAGVSKCSMILSDHDNQEDLNNVIRTNLNGMLACTKAAYRLMKKNDADGHIINMNSIMGHRIVPVSSNAPSWNIYPGTKHAITATTEVLRQELNFLKNRKVKVSSISPGLVKTEIIEVAGFPNGDKIFDFLAHLLPEDISEAILYILGTPPNVQVHELIIKPVGETI